MGDWEWVCGLQVKELMGQLNNDAEYEVKQINQLISYLEKCLEEHAKKSEMPRSEVGGKQEVDELRTELEYEKRDQDNR